MKTQHEIKFLEDEHFKNIKLSNQKIQEILWEEFDLIQWFLSRIQQITFCHPISKIHKFFLSSENKVQKSYITSNHSQDKIFEQKMMEQFHIKNKQKIKAGCLKLFITQTKQSKLISFDKRDKLLRYEFYIGSIPQKNPQNLNCFLEKQLKYPICSVQVQIKSQIKTDAYIQQISSQYLRNKSTQSKQQDNCKNHITLSIQENMVMKCEQSIFNILCSFLGINFNAQQFKPHITMKLISEISYLTLHQCKNIRSLSITQQPTQIPKAQKLNSQKKYQFIMRGFHNKTNKAQFQQAVFQYAQKVSNSLQKKTLNQNYDHQKSQFNHFICTPCDSFLTFILSLSPCLPQQFISDTFLSYTEILYPNESSSFIILQKNSQKGFERIKKALNKVLNQLILQYSKEINVMASKLSFIFQICQLINQSVITKQLLQKIVQLLSLYGTRYPDIILKADQSFEQICEISQLLQSSGIKSSIKKAQKNESVIKDKRNSSQIKKYKNQDKTIKQNLKQTQRQVWFSLYQMLLPGILNRLKHKLKKLLRKVLQKINITSQILTFQDHYKLTSTVMTIVVFDIISHKIRFLNCFTVPKMNILDLIYFQQEYQCLPITKQWQPYRIVYENQIFFINLNESILTVPIGIQFLQQFLDSKQMKQKYFSFNQQKISQQNDIRIKRVVFRQSSQSKQACNIRQKQMQIIKKKLISQIKQIIISSIPKKRLIWRVAKFKSSSQSIQKQQSTLTVIRKIEIVNHVLNILKTLNQFQKNLNREVWLQSQLNLFDEVKYQKKKFIQQGKQEDRMRWQFERIEFMKSLVFEQNKSFPPIHIIDSVSESISINLHRYVKNHFRHKQVFSDQNQSNIIVDFIERKLQSMIDQIKYYYKEQVDIEQKTFIQEIQSCMKDFIVKIANLNISLQGNKDKNQLIQRLLFHSDQLTITQLLQDIQYQLIRKIRKIQKKNYTLSKSLFKKIKDHQQKQILLQFTNLNTKLSQYDSLNQNIFKFFHIQSGVHKLILNLNDKFNKYFSIDIDKVKHNLYFQSGISELQYYDRINDNMFLVYKKIQKNITSFCKNNQSQNQNQNQALQKRNINKPKLYLHSKINILLDGEYGSEIYTEIYLKLLFKQLKEIYSTQNTSSQIKLQKFFQSFTCWSYNSITILELILKNNFTQNNQLNQQSFESIIETLPTLKYLLTWRNNEQIAEMFDSFKWHLIEQKQIQNLYNQVYTQSYQKQILTKSQISTEQFQQIQYKINQNTNKSENHIKNTLFFKQRQKIQNILAYQILQQWIQLKQTKIFKNQSSINQNLALEDLINNKIKYNKLILQKYTPLEQQKITTVMKKFIDQFNSIIQQTIFIFLNQPSSFVNQWKGILIKSVLSGFKLKKYIHQIFLKYNLNPQITFKQLNNLSKQSFHGQFNIILWNCQNKCLQVCNYLTKPQLPVWLAIYSSCIVTFYMQQQYSHKIWENPSNQIQNSLEVKHNKPLRKSFKQFNRSRKNPSQQQNHNIKGKISNYHLDPINQNQIVIKSRQKLSENSIQFSSFYSQQSTPALKKKALMGSLIDQNVNKYMSPNVIDPYPLLYLTSSKFQCLKPTPKQRKFMCLSFRNKNKQIFNRQQKDIFQGTQSKINVTDMISLFLNKKDSNMQSLRQFIRKSMKQSHFYLLFQTLLDGNSNLFRGYQNEQRQAHKINAEIEQQGQNIVVSEDISDTSVKDKKQQRISKNEQKISKNEQKMNNVKLSKIYIQQIDQYGDIIDQNQKISNTKYQFTRTFQQTKYQRQELKMKKNSKFNQFPSSSTNLKIIQMEQESKESKYLNKKQKGKKKQNQKKSDQNNKRQRKKQINKFKKFIFSCLCFSNDESPKNQQKVKKNKNI